jgi:hypothetical protein
MHRSSFRRCGLADIQKQIEKDVVWDDGAKAKFTIVHLKRIDVFEWNDSIAPVGAI